MNTYQPFFWLIQKKRDSQQYLKGLNGGIDKMGKTGYEEKQDKIRILKITPELEVVENQYADKDYIVELKTNEFTTVCPKTGLPDFATITIQYKPNKYLVEQKALKLYLNGYRKIGIFQEHATNKVFEDFINKVKPKWAKIEAVWNVRGGIGVKVVQEYLGNVRERKKHNNKLSAY